MLTMRERALKKTESVTGKTIDEIKETSPEDFRKYCESKSGKDYSFVSEYPTIGRGNVLRDGIIKKKELDAEIDRILT